MGEHRLQMHTQRNFMKARAMSWTCKWAMVAVASRWPVSVVASFVTIAIVFSLHSVHHQDLHPHHCWENCHHHAHHQSWGSLLSSKRVKCRWVAWVQPLFLLWLTQHGSYITWTNDDNAAMTMEEQGGKVYLSISWRNNKQDSNSNKSQNSSKPTLKRFY